jgi:hypothetical protein
MEPPDREDELLDEELLFSELAALVVLSGSDVLLRVLDGAVDPDVEDAAGVEEDEADEDDEVVAVSESGPSSTEIKKPALQIPPDLWSRSEPCGFTTWKWNGIDKLG